MRAKKTYEKVEHYRDRHDVPQVRILRVANSYLDMTQETLTRRAQRRAARRAK